MGWDTASTRVRHVYGAFNMGGQSYTWMGMGIIYSRDNYKNILAGSKSLSKSCDLEALVPWVSVASSFMGTAAGLC